MSFFLRFLLPGLTAGILFLLLSEIALYFRGERVTGLRRIFTVATELYLAGVFTLTMPFGAYHPFADDSLNLIPFKALIHAFSEPLNFFGNLLLYLPLGIFLPLLFVRGRGWLFALKTGAALSFSIELLQLFTTKSMDIDDILLNTLGTLAGLLIGRILLVRYPILRKNTGIFRAKTRHKKRRFDGRGIVPLAGFAALCILFANILVPISKANSEEITARLNPTQGEPAAIVNAVTVDGITASSALLYDPESGSVLYQKNGETPLPPASTAKMLTALTVLNYCEPQSEVTVGSEIHMIAKDSSTAGLLLGDRMTVRQLLYALLLPSGNDAAYVLAVYVGRTILNNPDTEPRDALAAFLKAENCLALKIGTVHTFLLSPDGYNTPGQYTSAHDLAIAAGELMRSSLLKEIVGTYRFSEVIASGRTLTFYNTNKLLCPVSSCYLEQANGIKTGTNTEAGACLVSGAIIQGKQYIAVVMGSTDEGRWKDTLEIYRKLS